MTMPLETPDIFENVKFLKKIREHWFYKKDDSDTQHQLRIDGDIFLVNNTQFIKINATQIVNLDFVGDYAFNALNGFFIIDGQPFDIPRRFIPSVRKIHKAYIKQKYTSKFQNDKGSWIGKGKNKNFAKGLVKKFDKDNVKYLIRDGCITNVYYENGDKRHFYDTLIFFESHIPSSYPFIRVCRNCIVNIKFLKSCVIDSSTKTGEIVIDSMTFNVSRRLLPKFKRKIREYRLVFLIQKRIE
jgi:LytTr DNA-binding domain